MARPGTRRYFANLAVFSAVAAATGAVVFAVALAYRAAAQYTHPGRLPTLGSPAQLGLVYEDVRLLTEDGLRLAAWYIPSRNRAAVVLLHGISANRDDVLPVGRGLVERGYGVLLVDLRAHGESEGQISTLGLHEVRDVRAAVSYLQRRPEVDPERLGVFGVSLGAATAIMAAAEMPELKAVVADSAFTSAQWLVRNQFNAFVRLPTWLSPLVLAFGSWQAGVDADQIAPVLRIGLIAPRPIMLIHGQQDQVFLVENALLLAEAAGEPKEVWIEPEVGHVGVYGADPGRYLDRVGVFLDRALQAPLTASP